MALDTHAKWVIIFPFSLTDFINCSKVQSWRFIDSAAHILTGIGCVRKRAGPSRNLYLRVPETLLYFLEEAGVCIEKKTNKLRLEVITVVDQKRLIFLVSISEKIRKYESVRKKNDLRKNKRSSKNERKILKTK